MVLFHGSILEPQNGVWSFNSTDDDVLVISHGHAPPPQSSKFGASQSMMQVCLRGQHQLTQGLDTRRHRANFKWKGNRVRSRARALVMQGTGCCIAWFLLKYALFMCVITHVCRWSKWLGYIHICTCNQSTHTKQMNTHLHAEPCLNAHTCLIAYTYTCLLSFFPLRVLVVFLSTCLLMLTNIKLLLWILVFNTNNWKS